MLVIAKITKSIFGLYYVLLNFELGIYFVIQPIIHENKCCSGFDKSFRNCLSQSMIWVKLTVLNFAPQNKFSFRYLYFF